MADSGILRFGVFELDLRAGELAKQGRRIRLQDQPFRILVMLVERPGEVVTREELRQKLWPADTFVDFDHGLNNAVNRLRDALGDSAETPRYIETLAKRGYRLIAQVGQASAPRVAPAPTGASAASAMGTPESTASGPEDSRRRFAKRAATTMLALSLIVLAVLAVLGLRTRLGRSAMPRIQSIAVLALDNLSGDPSQEYLADGFTDALTTDLAQIRSLRVISRASAMQYKGKRKAIPEIGRELNVDAVVEGSVVRSGQRVRVTAQLIDTVHDQHLWAQTYERDPGDLVRLQDEIARNIATAVRANLSPQERQRLANAHAIDSEAYQLYLMGHFYLEKRTEEGMLKALDYLQRAIDKDPGYAPAYAHLAETYNLLAAFRFRAPREVYPAAKQAALKALEIDPDLAEAHTVLGAVALGHGWDSEACEQQYQQAIELSPGYSTAHHWYARYLAGAGRYDEAIAEIKRARELDPLSLIINDNVAEIYESAGRYDDAIAELQKTLEMDPNYARTHLDLGSVYEDMGMMSAAIAEYQKSRQLDGENWPELLVPLQRAYEAGGPRGYYQAQLRLLKERAQIRYVSPATIGLLCADYGSREEALTWLEKAYQERDPNLLFLRTRDGPTSLRSDPRFQNLVRRIRLATQNHPKAG